MWDRVMDVNVRGTWLMTNACRRCVPRDAARW
jgi:NAD(P)-dependent dehydrogenase (short-subunit alcohol dehydrogenase family)